MPLERKAIAVSLFYFSCLILYNFLVFCLPNPLQLTLKKKAVDIEQKTFFS